MANKGTVLLSHTPPDRGLAVKYEPCSLDTRGLSTLLCVCAKRSLHIRITRCTALKHVCDETVRAVAMRRICAQRNQRPAETAFDTRVCCCFATSWTQAVLYKRHVVHATA